ncbi:MAG: alpha/beta hydrolase [Candidatus Eremiobacteraeota bacterium]|nr:alpha/beta hydrolase [Candidatus Eremiobacteraeota bacterium]
MLMEKRTMIMVPGYNEPPDHFGIMEAGKDGTPGLKELGFNCITFPQQDDDLRDRIDRFATHLTDLRNQGHPFPVVTLGYSLGGLVVRGFLRAYPERSHEVSHTIMIATPNWGVVLMAMPHLTRLMRVPDKAMGDMSLESDFMRWLNGTGGHWKFVHDKRNRLWELDNEPIIGPPDAKMLSIMGLIPKRGGDNDGLVWADSATLGDRIPAHYIIGPHCNHMNIIGHFDIVVMFAKGFLGNDKVWPLTLQAILDFVET